MNLDDLSSLCNKVMSFYNYNLNDCKIYSDELYEKLCEKYQKNLYQIKSVINKEIIDDLNNNFDKYINIYDYCIIFDESLISNETILKLLKDAKLNRYIYFHILTMHRNLNNEIIIYILNNINDNFKGIMPFDYQYHILKRTEINDDIRNEILSNLEKDELANRIEQLAKDLEKEFTRGDTITPVKVKKEKDLYQEYIVYDKLVDYYNKHFTKKYKYISEHRS